MVGIISECTHLLHNIFLVNAMHAACWFLASLLVQDYCSVEQIIECQVAKMKLSDSCMPSLCLETKHFKTHFRNPAQFFAQHC